MIHDPLSTVGCWCVVTEPDYDGSECLLSTLIQTSASTEPRVRSRGQSLRLGPEHSVIAPLTTITYNETLN